MLNEYKEQFRINNRYDPFPSDSIPYRPMTAYNYPASIE